MTDSKPVFTFGDAYEPESYWPDEYVEDAVPVLAALGWLTQPPSGGDRSVAVAVLDGISGLSLDETDAYPFGLLWALRATGAVGTVPGLDAQLRDWREWEETDHVGEPLDFLPSLDLRPTGTGWPQEAPA